jgi:glycosyltransferase involved in cell wall biosynthesis
MPTLLESLAEHYGARRAVAIEPDQSERPPVPARFPRLLLRRLPTIFHNFSHSGFVEYNLRASRLVNELEPDVLVVSACSVLPSVLKLRRRPRVTIYYMLEALDYYAGQPSWRSRFMIDLNRQAAKYVDLVIFPEENRAAIDLERGGLQRVPLAVCYNAVNRRKVAPPDDTRRRMRILYSGTIHKILTSAEFYLHPDLQDIPIDMWGLIDGPQRDEIEAAMHRQGGQVRFRGCIDSLKLAEIRPTYAYSIVMWAPVDRNTYYACPNKLFEAIADGVPPIAAPHPQCRTILERYQCGILMDDWTFPSFHTALRRAKAIYGTAEYDRLVANCRIAAEAELNWDHQFDKICRHLPTQV